MRGRGGWRDILVIFLLTREMYLKMLGSLVQQLKEAFILYYHKKHFYFSYSWLLMENCHIFTYVLWTYLVVTEDTGKSCSCRSTCIFRTIQVHLSHFPHGKGSDYVWTPGCQFLRAVGGRDWGQKPGDHIIFQNLILYKNLWEGSREI